MAQRKLKYGAWDRDEIKQLKKRFGNSDTHALAKDLGRSHEATKKKAFRLGLKKSKRYLKAIGRS